MGRITPATRAIELTLWPFEKDGLYNNYLLGNLHSARSQKWRDRVFLESYSAILRNLLQGGAFTSCYIYFLGYCIFI